MATGIELFKEVTERLFAAKKVLLMTHLRPDGDALGSCFGMRSFLRHNGVQAEIVLPSGMPRRFQNLCTGTLNAAEVDPDEFDLLLSLDCANIERLGMPDALDEVKLRQRGFISIDHHKLNSINAPCSILDPDAASACQVVTELICAGNREFGDGTATFLMMGMMTDTGNFCFANTTAQTFNMAAKLMEAGADVTAIANEVFFNKPFNQLKFESEFVNTFDFACDGKLAMAFIPQELMDKYNFNLNEDEGLIDLLRCLEGVVIAIMLHKRPDGFRVSMRSKSNAAPVGPLARRYGGGGHDLAAGMTLDLPDIDAVKELLSREISAVLQQA